MALALVFIAVATIQPVSAVDVAVTNGQHLAGAIVVLGKWTVPASVTAYIDEDVCVVATSIEVAGTLIAQLDGPHGANLLLKSGLATTITGTINGADGLDATAADDLEGKNGGHGSSIIVKGATIDLGNSAVVRVGAGGDGGNAEPTSALATDAIGGGIGGPAGWLFLDGDVTNLPAYDANATTGILAGANGGAAGLAVRPVGSSASTRGGSGGAGGGIATSDDLLTNATYGRDVMIETRDFVVASRSDCYGNAYSSRTVPSELQVFPNESCNGSDGADDLTAKADNGDRGVDGAAGSGGLVGGTGGTGTDGTQGSMGHNAQGGNGDDGCGWGSGGDGGDASSEGGDGGRGGDGGDGGAGSSAGGAGGTGGDGGDGGNGGSAKGGKAGCGGGFGSPGVQGVGTSTPGTGGGGGLGGSGGGGQVPGAPGTPGTTGQPGTAGDASSGSGCNTNALEF